jgi:hypothetical protein
MLYWFAKFEGQGPDLKVRDFVLLPSYLFLIYLQRLNTNGRPKQVQAWIKNHNKTIVPPLNIAVFSPQTLVWWKVNQPEWRTTGVDGLSPAAYHRAAPDDADWSSVARGGTAGVYTVVMALSWWVRSATVPWTDDLTTIVNDVTWVLRTLSDIDHPPAMSNQTLPIGPTKRAQVPNGDAPSTASGRQVKRYVANDLVMTFTDAYSFFQPSL